MSRFKLALLTPQFKNYTTYYLQDVLTDFVVQEQEYQQQRVKDCQPIFDIDNPNFDPNSPVTPDLESYQPLKHRKQYNYTYEEKVVRSLNSQTTLNFKMSQFVTKENEWLENPFLRNIAVGSRIVLEEIDNNNISHSTLFVVTKIQYEFQETNSIYSISCEDAFTYYTIRQHVNYTISNDPSTADFLGAHNIDWWVQKKIVPECHLTYDYLPLNEGLALLSDGSVLRFGFNENQLPIVSTDALNGREVVSILKTPYSQDQDSDYYQSWCFSCSNVTANQALKQLAEQLNFHIHTYEYPEINEDSLTRVYHKLFWLEPTHNDQRLGLTYTPKNTIQTFGLTQSGDSLTTVLNVANNTINDEVIAMIPTIPPFFRSTILLNPSWESTSFTPGFFWERCHSQQFVATTDTPIGSQWQIDFNTISHGGPGGLYRYIFPIHDALNPNSDFISIPSGYETFVINGLSGQWPSITFDDEHDNPQLWTNRSNIWGIRIRRYHSTSEVIPDEEIFINDGEVLPDLPSDAFFKIDLWIAAPTNCSNWRDPQFAFEWQRTASVEEEQFAEIADRCPWLENKLIDFNFFYQNNVLSKQEYTELLRLLQDQLRIINGRLLIYSEAYYNALHARTAILSEIQNELDLLGAACQADVLTPIITSGNLKKPILQTDFYQKYLNYCYRLNDKKTAIIDWEDLLSDYFQKIFSTEQRFLKNAYDFRQYFNAPISLQAESLYKYTFTLDDIPLFDRDTEAGIKTWYTMAGAKVSVVNESFKDYIGANSTNIDQSSLYNYGQPTVPIYQKIQDQYLPLEVVHQGNFQKFFIRDTWESQLRLGTDSDRYNSSLQYYYLVFKLGASYDSDNHRYFLDVDQSQAHPIGLTGTAVSDAYTGDFNFILVNPPTTYRAKLINLQRDSNDSSHATATFQIYVATADWEKFVDSTHYQQQISYDGYTATLTAIEHAFQPYANLNAMVRNFIERSPSTNFKVRQRPLYWKDNGVLYQRAYALVSAHPEYVLLDNVPSDSETAKALARTYWISNLPIDSVYYKGPVYSNAISNDGTLIQWYRLNKQGQTQADYANYLLNPQLTIVDNPYEYEDYQAIPFVNAQNINNFYHRSIKPSWIKVGLTILGILSFPYFPVSMPAAAAAAYLPYTYQQFRNDNSTPYYPVFYTQTPEYPNTPAIPVEPMPISENVLAWYVPLFLQSTSGALNQAALTYQLDDSISSDTWNDAYSAYIWDNITGDQNGITLTPASDVSTVPDHMKYYTYWRWLGVTPGLLWPIPEGSTVPSEMSLYMKDSLLELMFLDTSIVEPQRTYKVLRVSSTEVFNNEFKYTNSATLLYPFIESMADVVFTEVSTTVTLEEALGQIGYENLGQDGTSGCLSMSLQGVDYYCFIFKVSDYELKPFTGSASSYADLYNANDEPYVWTKQPIVTGCFIYDSAGTPETIVPETFDMTQAYYDTNNIRYYTIQQVMNGAVSAVFTQGNSYSCYDVSANPSTINLPLVKHQAHIIDTINEQGEQTFVLDQMTSENVNLAYTIDTNNWTHSSPTTNIQTAQVTINDITFNLHITQTAEIVLRGLTNGTFWWLYHDRSDIPFIQEHAAIIETQLTNYWNQMLTASKYCDYFLPDSWLPVSHSSVNPFFATQMKIVDTTYTEDGSPITVPSCEYVGAYVPKVAIYQKNNQVQLPSYQIKCVNNNYGFNTLASINAVQNPAFEHIINLLNINPNTWTAEENGTQTYYYAISGGKTWSEFLTSQVACNCSHYSGWYVMMFNYLKQAYMPRLMPSYQEYQQKHDNLWKELYERFPGILLQSNYTNETAVSSWDLYNLATYAFKGLSQPDADYSITVIQAYELEGKTGQELRIGDGIQLKAQDFYNEHDQIYKALSQYLFISQINYTLRDASSMSLTVNDVQYDNKLIRRLAKLMK